MRRPRACASHTEQHSRSFINAHAADTQSHADPRTSRRRRQLSSLPNEKQCASMIPVTPETVPANTPFNQTLPTAAQLSAYAANGYTSTYQDDYTQYKRVD